MFTITTSNNKLINSVLLKSLFGMLFAVVSINTVAVVPDGKYDLVILPVPFDSGDMGAFIFTIDPVFDQSSSFTFGALPGTGSQYMSDNGEITSSLRGSSEAGDGYAGVLGLDFLNDIFTIDSFQVDAILNTPGGTLVQYTDPLDIDGGAQTNGVSLMSGSVSGGTMDFIPEGRLVAVGFTSILDDSRLNYDNSQFASVPHWVPFTSGTSINSSGSLSLTGLPLTNIGDYNGDLLDDFSVTLVSAGNMGTDSGAKSGGISYVEVWKSMLLSNALPVAIDSSLIVIESIATTDLLNAVDGNAEDTFTFSIVSNGGSGTVVIDDENTGAYTYTPNLGVTGDDSFTFTVSDGSQNSLNTGVVTINIVENFSSIDCSLIKGKVITDQDYNWLLASAFLLWLCSVARRKLTA